MALLIKINITPSRFFVSQLQSSFYSWIHSSNLFRSSFNSINLNIKLRHCWQYSILRILDHFYPQNMWYLDFCVKLSFSVLYPYSILPQRFTSNKRLFVDIELTKQRLKGNSVLEIFVKKLSCCQKIVKQLAFYGLKRCLIIYPYAVTSAIMIYNIYFRVLGEKTLYGIFWSNCLLQIPSWGAIEKMFQIFLRNKSPLRMPCFNYCKLSTAKFTKTVLVRMFSYKFLGRLFP